MMIMKTKTFALLLFMAIFYTDAAELTDEDINSPLLSYLLAKLQRLESKMMVRPNTCAKKDQVDDIDFSG